MKQIVEYTTDGSATLYVPGLDEHYHSVKGARTESSHIFIGAGMKHSAAAPLHILEIGFGTGLNAFLTLMEAKESGREVYYTGIELYPLEWETVERLNYSDDPLFRAIHAAPWEEATEITSGFSLLKRKTDFTLPEEGTPSQGFDVVYFDAFAPEKQPEMWSEALFSRLYSAMNTGGILTTYCSKGVIRRMLQQIGFTTERLPGPPGGKREILRATKP